MYNISICKIRDRVLTFPCWCVISNDEDTLSTSTISTSTAVGTVSNTTGGGDSTFSTLVARHRREMLMDGALDPVEVWRRFELSLEGGGDGFAGENGDVEGSNGAGNPSAVMVSVANCRSKSETKNSII